MLLRRLTQILHTFQDQAIFWRVFMLSGKVYIHVVSILFIEKPIVQLIVLQKKLLVL